MSDGMGREFTYLSSHATNRYFIPNWGIDSPCNGGIIKVSSIGYTTVFRDCRGEDMGVIRLSEDSWMLGEIVVRSQLPKTVLSGEGMTTTISGSVLEKTANMEQLLSRIPSVSAKDGDIEVFGRGTPASPIILQ